VQVWLGHSKLVAEKHYGQVTDDDFRKAAGVTNETRHETRPSAPIAAGIASSKKGVRTTFPEGNGPLLTCTTLEVGGKGLEPSTSTV
jgi:hypothetical protein